MWQISREHRIPSAPQSSPHAPGFGGMARGQCLSYLINVIAGVFHGHHTGLGWHRVIFLHSGLYGAMFWVYEETVLITPRQQAGWRCTRS